jgi:hypothetical protein
MDSRTSEVTILKEAFGWQNRNRLVSHRDLADEMSPTPRNNLGNGRRPVLGSWQPARDDADMTDGVPLDHPASEPPVAAVRRVSMFASWNCRLIFIAGPAGRADCPPRAPCPDGRLLGSARDRLPDSGTEADRNDRQGP